MSQHLRLKEVAAELHVSRATAHRIFRNEPGVEKIRVPGSNRPITLIPRAVVDRVLKRSENR